MATVKKFEELKIWQKAREISKEVFKISCRSEFKNDYALRNQIRRSSGSVMDNIAEGFERDGKKEFVQFLFIAKGSAGEVRSQLYRCFDQDYITKIEFDELHISVTQECNMIAGLINYLKKSDLSGNKYKT